MADLQRPILLIWPHVWPETGIEFDLQRPKQSFQIVGEIFRHSWGAIYRARPGSFVLDPMSRANGELLSLIKYKGLAHVEGIDACRIAIILAEATHG